MLSLYRNQLKGVQKKVLLIGSGLMAEAVIDQLLKRNDNFVVVASAHVEDARKVIQNKQRCSAHHLDVTETEELRKFVQNSDIVIAYIPPQFIVGIAKICAEVGRSMITSQYTFPEIRALEQECKKKGIIILNEIGLDPGIDHLATVKVKDEVYAKGGKIIEYESWCGGVPSPEFCDNPFGYKFSWSPFAAIRNINNDAKYLENGVQKYYLIKIKFYFLQSDKFLIKLYCQIFYSQLLTTENHTNYVYKSITTFQTKTKLYLFKIHSPYRIIMKQIIKQEKNLYQYQYQFIHSNNNIQIEYLIKSDYLI